MVQREKGNFASRKVKGSFFDGFVLKRLDIEEVAVVLDTVLLKTPFCEYIGAL